MTDITSLGEILIDLTQTGRNDQGVAQFAANPGGAPANFAVAAARLGAKTAFIGKVGDDSFGASLKACLAENQVDVRGIAVDKVQHTTLAVVSVDEHGDRSFSFYRDPGADTQILPEEIPQDLLTDCHIFHFGSLSLIVEPAYSSTYYAVKAAKAAGALISYDPNYRPSLWNDEKAAVERMAEPLPLVDILKVSDEELPLLSGTSDLDAGTQWFADKGISMVLVTLGADGAFYRFKGRTGHIPGVPCKVGDTNGAGDTFFGATLSQLSKFEKLEDVSVEELERILALANKAASITTSRHGAIPAMPTWEEVMD